jgi:outer membrane protein TolC
VLAAHETLVTLRSAVESLDHEGLPAAEAVVAATQASFLAGKLERVRVVMARRDLIQARDRRLQLIEDGWRAYGEMAAILGELP